jgi:hypothetical protein
MLMSSGVVLMFPLFYCLRNLGCLSVDFHLLTLSYPWLGVPIEQLRSNNKPVTPFIVAHVTKVLVYYRWGGACGGKGLLSPSEVPVGWSSCGSMYEACQLLWAEALYNKSVPSGLQFWVYGVVMIWEVGSPVLGGGLLCGRA